MSLCWTLIIASNLIVLSRAQLPALLRRPFQRATSLTEEIPEKILNSTFNNGWIRWKQTQQQMNAMGIQRELWGVSMSGHLSTNNIRHNKKTTISAPLIETFTAVYDSSIIEPEHCSKVASQPKKSSGKLSDYIERYGYTAEHHNVITQDGYLISVFRIPSEGSPIILQHGLLLASDSWVLQGPEYDLAFILADKGYDVWIADSRGNTFSRVHLRLPTKNPKFWNFSFHEMGFYDIPAVIDYILHNTKYEQVDIIAHSIGATSALIMCSTRPEYNGKVRSLVALAPGVFYNSTGQSHVQQILARYGPYLKYLHFQSGINEFFPRHDVANRAMRRICQWDSPLYHLCLFYMQNLLGFSSITKQHHKPAIEYAQAVPRGVSYKTLMHLAQLGQTGKLAQRDYGPKVNLEVYGSRLSPEYNLSSVVTPVALLFSDGDAHISSEDVLQLKSKLPNVVASYRIDKHLFNHMDFLWGSEARTEVFDFVLEVLSHLDNQNTETNESS